MGKIWAVLAGAVAGGTLSATGAVPLLSFYGFWAGGLVPLALLAPAAVWYAVRRQRAGTEVASLVCGTVAGLAPGAWYGAEGSANFALELCFPIFVGIMAALVLAPAYVVITRQVARAGRVQSAEQ